MEGRDQQVPVRIYRKDNHVTLAAPMPGLSPQDIFITIVNNTVRIRGEDHSPGQHDMDFIVNEWSVGPYERQITIPEKVRGDLANATYGNGVLVLSMPKAEAGAQSSNVSFQLHPIDATRGERVGHTGKDIHPATTSEHRGKHP